MSHYSLERHWTATTSSRALYPGTRIGITNVGTDSATNVALVWALCCGMGEDVYSNYPAEVPTHVTLLFPVPAYFGESCILCGGPYVVAVELQCDHPTHGTIRYPIRFPQ